MKKIHRKSMGKVEMHSLERKLGNLGIVPPE